MTRGVRNAYRNESSSSEIRSLAVAGSQPCRRGWAKRLMTAKIAGSIQAAETIIHGRRRDERTAPQYRWSTSRRNTVHVNGRAARVLVIDSNHEKAQKAHIREEK